MSSPVRALSSGFGNDGGATDVRRRFRLRAVVVEIMVRRKVDDNKLNILIIIRRYLINCFVVRTNGDKERKESMERNE